VAWPMAALPRVALPFECCRGAAARAIGRRCCGRAVDDAVGAGSAPPERRRSWPVGVVAGEDRHTKKGVDGDSGVGVLLLDGDVGSFS
jgi:hypothetical protein